MPSVVNNLQYSGFSGILSKIFSVVAFYKAIFHIELIMIMHYGWLGGFRGGLEVNISNF